MAQGQESARPPLDDRRALEGRRALVVGGTGGIGKAVAFELAARGAELFLLGGRDRRRLEATMAEIRKRGGSARGRALDLADASVVSALDLPSLLEGETEFDVLVVAFGPFLQKPLVATGPAEWTRIAALDLALPGALASVVLPAMVERRWGRLLFFGGTGTDALRGYRTNAAYAAAKTGLGVLAKSIALQHADDGIAAFVVCPGLVDTEYLEEDLRRSLEVKAPGGRLLGVEGLARTAVELLAAEPCLVSGATIAMDAGLAFAR